MQPTVHGSRVNQNSSRTQLAGQATHGTRYLTHACESLQQLSSVQHTHPHPGRQASSYLRHGIQTPPLSTDCSTTQPYHRLAHTHAPTKTHTPAPARPTPRCSQRIARPRAGSSGRHRKSVRQLGRARYCRAAAATAAHQRGDVGVVGRRVGRKEL